MTGVKLSLLVLVPIVRSPFWDSVLVLVYLLLWLETRVRNHRTLKKAAEIVEFHHRRYDDVAKKAG